MIPHEPPRTPGIGFLYFHPYRVQGYSIAGEETFVQIPELDICFDIGRAPRLSLPSNFVALSHGHMDHAAGLAYYFSQRHFQGMGTGTLLCHPELAPVVENLMAAWVDIERQQTPFNVIAMDPNDDSAEIELKNNIWLRAFKTDHTSRSLGYVIYEKRSKLLEEFVGLPQDKLVELKKQGTTITRILHIPLVAYLGDTAMGDHLLREDVCQAKILITECTFFDKGHRERARVGKHLHVSDLGPWLEKVEAEAIVLTHLSRRTVLNKARNELKEHLSEQMCERIHFLMDTRTNRARYQRQKAEAEQQQAEV